MKRQAGKPGLSQSDLALWRRVTEGTVPLVQFTPDPARTDRKKLRASAAESMPAADIAPFQIGERAGTASAHEVPRLEAPRASPHMDKRNFERLKRGRIAVEARLDLHGMRLDEAHPALVHFVTSAHRERRRLVLVITGKGRPQSDRIMPGTRGILRRQVPVWLRLAPLAPLVLEITPAARHHGGEGAFYVYLRRQR